MVTRPLGMQVKVIDISDLKPGRSYLIECPDGLDSDEYKIQVALAIPDTVKGFFVSFPLPRIVEGCPDVSAHAWEPE